MRSYTMPNPPRITVLRFPVSRCMNPESKLGVQASDTRGAKSPQSILNTLRPADFTGSKPSVGLYVWPCSAADCFAAIYPGPVNGWLLLVVSTTNVCRFSFSFGAVCQP